MRIKWCITMILWVLFIFYALFARVDAQVSSLDAFVGPFRAVRLVLHGKILRTARSSLNLKKLVDDNKLQMKFDEFPCSLNNSRSQPRPTSVHRFRPGDIDVIGALGDSLTVGYGAFATNPLQVIAEYRGVSFPIGGEGSWRDYLTIPNILKEFNPDLYGFSTGDCLTIERCSKFNVAEAAAVSDNMPYMAEILVKRILADPKVDVANDWKLINVMIGSNDFCSELCYSRTPEKLLDKHWDDMIRALRTLKRSLPRTLVNIIPPLSPAMLDALHVKPEICKHITLLFECPCYFGVVPTKALSYYKQVMLRWQEIDLKLGELKEFQAEDFAVVIQSFTTNMSLPVINNNLDISYLSADCFHLSQKGNAAMAYIIWNSLLTPVARKGDVEDYDILKNMLCPSEERPYIVTNFNS